MSWSPLQQIDLDTVPMHGRPHTNSACSWRTPPGPSPAGSTAYLDKAGTLYDETLSSQKEEGTGIIELEAAFQPVYGTHMTTEVILWQRVVNTKAVMWMLGHDLPPSARRRGPGCTMPSRCATAGRAGCCAAPAWSPLY